MKILITGSKGFVARNLFAHLSRSQRYTIFIADRNTTISDLRNMIQLADVVVHLAGENRPNNPTEFFKVNTVLTQNIVEELEKKSTPYLLLYASSVQATLKNDYGISKKQAEDFIGANVKKGSALIFRFPGIFGKWCKPNYNSVVATYCYNIAHNLPVQVRDENYECNLIYIDDVIKHLMNCLDKPIKPGQIEFVKTNPVYTISLGKLSEMIAKFRDSRQTYFLPQVDNPLEKKMYSTYLTYLPETEFSYDPLLRNDERGSLFELLKTASAGQIFVSSTKPGITRGNHFHHTKTEKFCVVAGHGLIEFRKIDTSDAVLEYIVSGDKPCIIDIPPGYTHNIKNIGNSEMITLFWANEIFNSDAPDTYFEKV